MYLNPRHFVCPGRGSERRKAESPAQGISTFGMGLYRGFQRDKKFSVPGSQLERIGCLLRTGNREPILQWTTAAVSKAARFAVSISGRNSAAVIPSVPPEKPSM